jgi:hypothetical protein
MGVTQIDTTQTINNATWRVQPDVITSESGIVKENGTIHYIDGKLKYHSDGSIKELGVGVDYAVTVLDIITSLPSSPTTGDRYLYPSGDYAGVIEWNGEFWAYVFQNTTAPVGTIVTNTRTNVTYRWSGSSWVVYTQQKVLDLTLSRKTDSYTLLATDNGQVVEMNKATANTLTVPNSVFSAGQQVLITQYGAGQTTIAAGAGVTLRSSGGKLKLTNQYATATLIFISASEAYVSGNLTA